MAINERSQGFTHEDENIINNHVNEIAALPEEQFTEFVDGVVNARSTLVEVLRTLHPDRPGQNDLGQLFDKDIGLLMEITRRARDLRSER